MSIIEKLKIAKELKDLLDNYGLVNQEQLEEILELTTRLDEIADILIK